MFFDSYPSALDPSFSPDQIYADIAAFVRRVLDSDQLAFDILPGEQRRVISSLPLGEWLDALPWWLAACEGATPDDPAINCFKAACRRVGLLFHEGRRRRVTVNTSTIRHARHANELIHAIRYIRCVS